MHGEQKESKSPKREYPPLYEKAVPIALVVIAVAIVVLLVLAVGVALGLFAGS